MRKMLFLVCLMTSTPGTLFAELPGDPTLDELKTLSNEDPSTKLSADELSSYNFV